MVADPAAHPPLARAPVPCRILGRTTIHLAPPKPWGERQRTICGLFNVLVAVAWSGPTWGNCRQMVGWNDEERPTGPVQDR
jgi:hypothetical protein